MKLPAFAVGAVLAFCLLQGIPREATAAGGNAHSLAAAESAFAQEARTKGTRTAFLHVLSSEGIVFEPGPQNGRKAWRAKKESKSLLEWQPVLAAVSTNGDLGYTTGPYSLKEKPTDQKAAASGQFVSIWRWEKGQWKLFFDLGSDNPPPTGPAPELQLVDNHAPNESATVARAVMLARDRGYVADRAANLPGCAEETVRLYQPQKFPVIGPAAGVAALQRIATRLRFRESKAEVSQGGDLGFVWGEYQAGTAPETAGYYLRIWRKDRSGTWKLALDLIHPR